MKSYTDALVLPEQGKFKRPFGLSSGTRWAQSQKVRLQRLLTLLGGRQVVNTIILGYLEAYKTKSIQLFRDLA